MILTIGDIPGPVRDAFARGEEVLLFTARAESRLSGLPEVHALHMHITIDEDRLTPGQQALADRILQAMDRPVRRIKKRAARAVAEIQRSGNLPSLDLFTFRCTVQQNSDSIAARLSVEVALEVSENLDIQAAAEKALQRSRAALYRGGIECR